MWKKKILLCAQNREKQEFIYLDWWCGSKEKEEWIVLDPFDLAAAPRLFTYSKHQK